MNVLENQVKRRTFLLLIGFVMALFSLGGRVYYIKHVNGEEYEQKAVLQQANTEHIIPPNRGSIVDRNHHDMALSMIVYDVILDPFVLLQADQLEQEKTIKALHEELSLPVDAIKTRIEDNKESKYEVVAKKISAEKAKNIKSANLKGVWLKEDSLRNYVRGTFASQVLGFVNRNGQAQYGVEQQYNEWLTGVPGRVFPMLKEGEYILEENIPPIQGNTIVLTIDETIQQYAERALQKAVDEHNPKNASVIAMDPNTGEILAMAAYPTYNPNEYNDLSGMKGFEKWGSLSNQQKLERLMRVWKNYNISNTYEPGSTFKAILVAAALEENIISEEDTFQCNGVKDIYGTKIRCWKHSGHGEQTLAETLANSCNVAMMDIVEKMGKDIFYQYQKKFGFGDLTGIDLPGEAAGILHPKEKLGPTELATSAFGQTFNATPLQMLNGFAAVINGGNLMQPYVVAQIIDENRKVVKEARPIIIRKAISGQTSDTVRKYLETVVTSGTGKKAKIPGYRIGGKTGTAQKLPREEEKYVLSFIGFTPVENPQIILLVLLDETEDPSEESGATALTAKEIMKNIVQYMEIAPTDEESVQTTAEIPVEDYRGLKLMEVGMDLTVHGLDYETIGIGSIIGSQYPNPGTVVPEGTAIKLYMQSVKEGEGTIIPNLKGKTRDEAKNILDKVGLAVNIQGEGIVTAQSPKAGVWLEKGSEIKIVLKK